tara:strand:- start:2059 stop:2616 length:558 start_codon:yes stop_codon:yes gene_type:complete
MGPRVKQYLLFMFGNWSVIEKNAEVVNNIRDVMETIVTEEEFTFITGDHIIIMCIKSRMSFEEIEEILKEFLTPFINTLFLMPKPKKLSYRLDENLKNHLFGDNKKKYKHIDPKIAEILTQQLKSIVSDRVKKIKKDIDKTQKITNFRQTRLVPMTIDGLLDKIIDEGISSLTNEEKEFLNKFNK